MRFLLLVLATFATAEGQTLANEIYQLNSSELLARAQKGEPMVQYRLAGLLLSSSNTSGVRMDYAESMKWMEKAHEQGYLPATYYMGQYYHLGMGVARNTSRALKYFLEAANKGYPVAQATLGRIYLAGLGVNPSKTEGMKWMNLALNQRDPSAAAHLAYFAENGLSTIRKDKLQAAAYYAVAVEFGAIGGAETILEKLKAQMTPEQKAEVIKRTNAILVTLPPAKINAAK